MGVASTAVRMNGKVRLPRTARAGSRILRTPRKELLALSHGRPPDRFVACRGRVGRVRAITASAAVLVACCAGSARAAECPNADAVKVPGAEMQKSACLDDLTTA